MHSRGLTLAAVGMVLVLVSGLAVVQSVREVRLWQQGTSQFDETTYGIDTVVQFAGMRISAVDDQPVDSIRSEEAFEGHMQFVLDGTPLGTRTRAQVRRGRNNFGRYHLWADVWRFVDRDTRDSSLWLVRRIQADDSATPRFEVTTLWADGRRRQAMYRAHELGRSYPLFRSTQFVRYEAAAFPLSVLDAFYFPPVLLVFPIGTLALGVYLVIRARRAVGITQS